MILQEPTQPRGMARRGKIACVWAMTDDEAWNLEQQFWTGAAAFYEQALHPECVIHPGRGTGISDLLQFRLPGRRPALAPLPASADACSAQDCVERVEERMMQVSDSRAVSVSWSGVRVRPTTSRPAPHGA